MINYTSVPSKEDSIVWIEDTMAVDMVAADSVSIIDDNELTPSVPARLYEPIVESDIQVPISRPSNLSVLTSKPSKCTKTQNEMIITLPPQRKITDLIKWI